jgi:hypothetical protein
MEDVIDRSHVSRSPEELAIHFVLRHAECRDALSGRTQEERPSDAPAGHRSTTAAPASTSASQCGESLALNSPPAAAVTQDDTCIARFLRAYAATRHFGAEPTSGGVRL